MKIYLTIILLAFISFVSFGQSDVIRRVVSGGGGGTSLDTTYFQGLPETTTVDTALVVENDSLKKSATIDISLIGLNMYDIRVERNITSVNESPYSLSSNDYILDIIYTQTDSCIITLPQPSTVEKRLLVFKDGYGNAATKGIRIETPTEPIKIDGQNRKIITVNYGLVCIYSTGAQYRVLYTIE